MLFLNRHTHTNIRAHIKEKLKDDDTIFCRKLNNLQLQLSKSNHAITTNVDFRRIYKKKYQCGHIKWNNRSLIYIYKNNNLAN